MGRRVFIKIGGSLIRPSFKDGLLRLVSIIRKLSRDNSIILLAGGGGVVEMLRSLDQELDFEDRNAHFAAIAGMEMNSYILLDLFPDAHRVTDIETEAFLHPLCIFFPLEFFRHCDPLPHSWDVSSDSMALYLAQRLRCDLLVLLKSVDGIYDGKNLLPHLSLDDLGECDVVDRFFKKYPHDKKCRAMECRILNGRHPDRLNELFTSGATIGTELIL